MRQILSTLTRSARPLSTSAASIPVGGLATVQETRSSLSPKVAGMLAKFPGLITIPVQWGEQDAYGHLNNVAYMRYCESGRIAYFEQVVGTRLAPADFDGFIKGKKVGPIVKTVAVNYRRVVEYPDTLTVGVGIDWASVKGDRFDQVYSIVSHKLGAVVADGRCTIVTYDYELGKKADIPRSVLAAMEQGDKELASSTASL